MKLYETYTEGERSVSFEVARADLASMVGTATESVIRVLSEFKKDGLIEVNGSEIVIVDPDKISSIKF